MVRRLWDSWEDDAEIRDAATGRFVDRDKLHYIDFEGRHFRGEGAVDHPRPPQGQPLVTALAHATVPYRFAARHADVVYVTPHDPPGAAAIVAEVRAEQAAAGRADEPLPIFADLVVLLDETEARAVARLERLNERAGEAYRSDALIFTGTPTQLADLLAEWAGTGLSGFRLRPAALPHDLDAIAVGLVPELRRRALFRAGYQEGTLRATLGPAPTGKPLRACGNRRPAMTKPIKQIHLGAHFPGVNNTTVWSDPRSGSHIEFSSFVHMAQTAERGKFDFLFLAEGLRLREHKGKIHDLDVVGRPDTFTVLAALAAVTDRLGLAGTINSTFNEPYEVARQFASLDHLSAGRAAWNVVTSWDAFTGENFRRGGFLGQDDRYARAKAFMHMTWELFDSWAGDEIVADKETGQFLRDPLPGRFEHHDAFFDIAGQFNVPRSPQGRPVIFQAGDSEEGREFAAATADAIFSRHATLDAGKAFYTDVKGRLARYGRTYDQLVILPAATFILGDTDEDAGELAAEVRLQQVSGQTALNFVEQLWNRDLSDHDPEGPLPVIDPQVGENTVAKGRASVRMYRDPLATAAEWRALAEAKHLSTRQLVAEVTNRQSFVGSPATIADQIDRFVQEDAADGFILVPHITPGGLDGFADAVIPLLQERGHYRHDYEGPTFRDHLGLPPSLALSAGSAIRSGVSRSEVSA